MEKQIKTDLRDFIADNYLFSDISGMPADDDLLIEGGVIDSTGVLELIEFLEERYQIEVTETETVPENLGSISNLTRFVLRKRSMGDGDGDGGSSSQPLVPADAEPVGLAASGDAAR